MTEIIDIKTSADGTIAVDVTTTPPGVVEIPVVARPSVDVVTGPGSSSDTAAEILAKLVTVDGPGSGLDADLLDGHDSTYFAPINSPSLSGAPTSPTPAPGDASTRIATTGFVQTALATGGGGGGPAPSGDPPLMDGVAAPGTTPLYSRGDHVHPSDTSRVMKAGDTMTGHLSLPTGPAAANAVRKDYVDAADAVNDALKVSKTGDTMSGHLTLPTGPAAGNAVRKDYVDAADGALSSAISAGDALKVAKAGDTMTGGLTFTMANPYIILNAPTAGTPREMHGRLNNVMRWLVQIGDGAAESGANAGSNFIIHRYADGGGYLGAAFTIERSSGNANIGGHLAVTGRIAGSGAVKGYPFEVKAEPGYTFGVMPAGGGTTQIGALNDASTAWGNILAQGAWTFGGSIVCNGTIVPAPSSGGVASTGNHRFEVQGAGGGDAFFAFHRLGVFACNFGLGSDNNLYYGGWSFGAAAYQLWSKRDFGRTLIDTRLTYHTDQAYNATVIESYQGAVITAVNSAFVFRYRWLQIQLHDGSWIACGLA